MPYNLHIVRAKDFVRLNSQEHVDFDESVRALRNIAKTCVERGVENALLDVREATSDLTLTEVYMLAKSFHLMGFNEKNQLAVLHRYRSGERAEFFAKCAEERGWNVRAFESFEEAIEWFSREETPR